jgi:serine/threonine-protein kinase
MVSRGRPGIAAGHPDRPPREEVPEERIAGRYRVEATLGRGGMGVVYSVVDEGSGQPLALKRLLLSPDAAKQATRTALFEREYHTLVHLRHPRIVAALDYGFDTNGPYYTMELLEGSDLKQRGDVTTLFAEA